MTENRNPIGDIQYYRYISILIFGALCVSGAVLLWLNSTRGRAAVEGALGQKTAFGLQLFFLGCAWCNDLLFSLPGP